MGYVRATIVVTVSLLFAIALPAEDAKKEESSSEMTPQAARAIASGLAWLSANQGRNGSWGGQVPVATTSVACLALMAGGHIPGRGAYGENVRRGLNFILRCASRSGYINESTDGSMGGSSRMHGHGYAALFLAEIYGMTHNMTGVDTVELKAILTRAIRLIENSQDSNGGWTYEPVRSGHEGSVTVTQIHALRAARNAGIKVDINVINRAVDYIKKSSNADGTVNYQLGYGRPSYPLTAAGVCVFLYLGLHNEESTKKAMEALIRYQKGGGSDESGMRSAYYYYTHFYEAIAMSHAGGDLWREYFPKMRDDLVRKMGTDGSWRDSDGSSYGGAYGTGFACIILQIPNRYLPILQN